MQLGIPWSKPKSFSHSLLTSQLRIYSSTKNTPKPYQHHHSEDVVSPLEQQQSPLRVHCYLVHGDGRPQNAQLLAEKQIAGFPKKNEKNQRLLSLGEPTVETTSFG